MSNLDPSQRRRWPGHERQRRAALALVASRRESILAAAERHGIAAEAIAGAILWDALENPYLRPWFRLGPGKVRPVGVRGAPSAAELVERTGLVPYSPRGPVARWRLLRDPDVAIAYIAGILAYYAATYRRIAGVEISHDAAVLTTLYQGGQSEKRAAQLRRRRAIDPSAMPRPGDEMGPWVKRHIDFIRATLAGRARAAAPAAPIESTQSEAMVKAAHVPRS